MVRTIDYKELRGEYVLVDVRSPREYSEATIPGAVNVPLFNDEERALIGTIYTRESTEKAKKIGVDIVSKKLPQIYEEIKNLEEKYHKVVMFCARGGMRSASIAELLGALGVKIERIKGGYKGYRAVINEELPKLNEEVTYVVLHGNTGVGKTEILKKLIEHKRDVVDLEGFANHRGSILGSVGLEETYSQKYFESLIYEKLKSRKTNYVFIEAESRRIGKVLVPEYIHNKMKEGIHIFLDADLDFRSNLIINEYTKGKNCNEELCDAIMKIRKYISVANLEQYCERIRNNDYTDVVKELMIKYYDPLYMHSSNQYKYDLKIIVESIEASAKQLEDFIDNYKNHVN